MTSSFTLAALLGTLLVVSTIPDAASYSKYGRTCKDIGCRKDEVCVMAEDPCTIYERDNCGRYPTCEKSRPGEASCASIVCQENEYCRTENGVPTCVKRTAANGYESAGVSYVNGQRTTGDESHGKPAGTGGNSNPYANANAPPPPVDPVPAGSGFRQTSAGTNLGYPPYPNAGSSGASNGYPPYPSSNQGNRQSDLGYPPYPTHNRMPMPAYPGQGVPYPGQQGYPPAPGYPQQYPGHQNYPYASYPNQNRMYTQNMNSIYRRNHNNGFLAAPSFLAVTVATFAALLFNRS